MTDNADDAITTEILTGIGGRFTASLDSKFGPQGVALTAELKVIGLSNGQFYFLGALYAGCTANTGPSAYLRLAGSNTASCAN